MMWLFIYASILLFLSWRCGLLQTGQAAQPEHVGQAAERFFVNGRASSTGAVAFSIIASCVGGSATLGMTGLAWSVGMPALWWLCAGALGLCVLAAFLARKVRQSGARTLPEMITTFIGAPARPVASIIILVAWLSITAAQFSALATLLQPLLQTPPWFTLIVGACFVTLHALWGGQRAIIKSDAFHAIFLLTTLLLILGLLWYSHGMGMGTVPTDVVIELANDNFPMSKVSYFLLIIGGSYIVCPMLFGRLLSAKSEGAAQRGTLLAALGLVLAAVVLVSVGVWSRGLVPADTAPQGVLMALLTDVLPPWAGMLGILALVSAIISSADSSLFTAASIAGNDILRKKDVNTCRLCTLAVALGSLALALPGTGVLELLLMANDIYVCGVVVPVFVGMMAYKEDRTLLPLTTGLLTGAMVVGGGLGFCAAFTGNELFSYAGLGAALVISLVAVRKQNNLVACKG